jgi:S-adenosylmethionine-diacylgycerolhomoserine-N-methlytransferase
VSFGTIEIHHDIVHETADGRGGSGCLDSFSAVDPVHLFALHGFDRVFISYALSMIPAWREVVRHAAALVAPGGKLFIVDFGNFGSYPELLRRAQLAWLRRFSVVPIPAMDRKIGMLAEQMGFTAVTERLYGGYAVRFHLQPR